MKMKNLINKKKKLEKELEQVDIMINDDSKRMVEIDYKTFNEIVNILQKNNAPDDLIMQLYNIGKEYDSVWYNK